jgi:hypothetical protein
MSKTEPEKPPPPDDTPTVGAPDGGAGDENNGAERVRQLLLEKRLSKENEKVSRRNKELLAHVGAKTWDEYQQKKAQRAASGDAPAPDAKQYDELTKLRLLHAIDEALLPFDFLKQGARAATRRELLAMSKLDDSGALVLVDEETDAEILADAETLRGLFADHVSSYTGAGSSAKGPSEAALLRSDARNSDDVLIEKGRASQKFFEEHRAEIVAAERRRSK